MFFLITASLGLMKHQKMDYLKFLNEYRFIVSRKD